MTKEDYQENIDSIKEKAACIADLLDVAKGYCDFNLGKCHELASVGTMLEFLAKAQKELVAMIDACD